MSSCHFAASSFIGQCPPPCHVCFNERTRPQWPSSCYSTEAAMFPQVFVWINQTCPPTSLEILLLKERRGSFPWFLWSHLSLLKCVTEEDTTKADLEVISRYLRREFSAGYVRRFLHSSVNHDDDRIHFISHCHHLLLRVLNALESIELRGVNRDWLLQEFVWRLRSDYMDSLQIHLKRFSW